MYNFLKECYSEENNSKRKIVLKFGLIGAVIFGYLTWNYLDIISCAFLPHETYILIYFMIGILLAISLSLIFVGL
jgi:hypothetical protein